MPRRNNLSSTPPPPSRLQGKPPSSRPMMREVNNDDSEDSPDETPSVVNKPKKPRRKEKDGQSSSSRRTGKKTKREQNHSSHSEDASTSADEDEGRVNTKEAGVAKKKGLNKKDRLDFHLCEEYTAVVWHGAVNTLNMENPRTMPEMLGVWVGRGEDNNFVNTMNRLLNHKASADFLTYDSVIRALGSWRTNLKFFHETPAVGDDDAGHEVRRRVAFTMDIINHLVKATTRTAREPGEPPSLFDIYKLANEQYQLSWNAGLRGRGFFYFQSSGMEGTSATRKIDHVTTTFAPHNMTVVPEKLDDDWDEAVRVFDDTTHHFLNGAWEELRVHSIESIDYDWFKQPANRELLTTCIACIHSLFSHVTTCKICIVGAINTPTSPILEEMLIFLFRLRMTVFASKCVDSRDAAIEYSNTTQRDSAFAGISGRKFTASSGGKDASTSTTSKNTADRLFLWHTALHVYSFTIARAKLPVSHLHGCATWYVIKDVTTATATTDDEETESTKTGRTGPSISQMESVNAGQEEENDASSVTKSESDIEEEDAVNLSQPSSDVPSKSEAIANDDDSATEGDKTVQADATILVNNSSKPASSTLKRRESTKLTESKKKPVVGPKSQNTRTKLPNPGEEVVEPKKKGEELAEPQTKVVELQEPKRGLKETAEKLVESKEKLKKPKKKAEEPVKPLFEPEDLPQPQLEEMTKHSEKPKNTAEPTTEPQGLRRNPERTKKKQELQEQEARMEQIKSDIGPEDEQYVQMAAELPELRDQRLATEDQNRDVYYEQDGLKFEATAYRNQRAAEDHLGNAFRLYQLLPDDHSVLWRPELKTKLPQLVQDDVPNAEYLYELNKDYTKKLWKAISEEEKEEWRAHQKELEKEQMLQIQNGWIRKNPPKRKETAKTASEPKVKKPK